MAKVMSSRDACQVVAWPRRRPGCSSRPDISELCSADTGAPAVPACTALILYRAISAVYHAADVSSHDRTCECWWRDRQQRSATERIRQKRHYDNPGVILRLWAVFYVFCI